MLIDTHCHLDFPDFEGQIETIIKKANEAGVTRLITIGTTLSSSKKAVELAEQFPEVYATVGHHPCNWDDYYEDEIQELNELCENPRVVAIGECGLDYHWLPQPEDFPNAAEHQSAIETIKSKQKLIFRQQLELAAKQNLNVVVHQRDSWNDCLEQLEPFHGKLRAVFHCFSGTQEAAATLWKNSHLVSITGIATFKKSEELRETLAQLPDRSFMVETDAPYLAPVPHRGKRCEPSMTRLTAETIAESRRISLDVLAKVTTKTAENFFAFP
ncbi:MAG: TatD family hydrolase [Verrucomicrobiota bacterium]